MRSKNYYDTLAWVNKAIESCANIQQCISASRLVRNFRIQCKNQKNYIWLDHATLSSKMSNKYSSFN